MRQLSITFFVAAALAALPAHAGERPPISLATFDEATQLYAKLFCKPSPKHGPLWRVEVSVEGKADYDDGGIVKASYAGKKLCRWHSRGSKAPIVQWPETFVIPVPEGDERPVPLIAFDRGVQKLVSEGNRCDDDIRPDGFGRFRGLKFRLQATVDRDGVLRANQVFPIGCDWYPLPPAG